MKNVASLKSNKLDSPKTPGGISKSLLTPCRRVGLSRNWRKGGVSPFVSPLHGNKESEQETPIKRKIDDVDSDKSKNRTENDINTTPSRNVNIPRRKKSKILSVDPELTPPVTKSCQLEENVSESSSFRNTPDLTPNEVEVTTPIFKSNSKNSYQDDPSDVQNNESEDNVTPILKSKKGNKFRPPNTSKTTNDDLTLPSHSKDVNTEKEKATENSELKNKKNARELKAEKKKSPENLTKECIVIIQKKIFKKTTQELEHNDDNETKKTSQVLFDSDSDDVPLCQLNTKECEDPGNKLTEKNSHEQEKVQNTQIQPRVLDLKEKDDYIEASNIKVHKLEDKTTSTSSLKKLAKKNKKPEVKAPLLSSQSSDDDDFEFNTKRTILVKKSYDKVSKPLKAKSTGSITQRDIDELRARIEVKKKLLLAKAMTNDTVELRTLIKKWQKGCQDALSELMDLMRSKFPDKQNMDFSEMLATLKIPTNLVGYDEENDCFNTPEDANIVLAKFNDL